MKKEEFKRLLKAHGYAPLKARTIEGVIDWQYLHNGWMYKEVGETEIAFWLGEGTADPQIHISIKQMDSGIDYITESLQIINFILVLFDAPILQIGYEYRITL